MSDITAPNALKTAAFTDILMRFQWPLYTFLRGIVSDQEQAHDLMQDVFCDGWRAVQRAASPFDLLIPVRQHRRRQFLDYSRFAGQG